MLHIVIGSTNPVKETAARQGLQQMLPDAPVTTERVRVPSGVSDQPRSDAETLHGATNRAQAAREARPDADVWVGIEGGIDDRNGHMMAFAWVVIETPDRSGQARSASFQIPEAVAERVRRGEELGHADDAVFDRSESKRDEGAVGIMTGGVIDRAALYEHAVVLALAPICNASAYAPAGAQST
mgnify:CR=1 FL=1